MSIGHIRPSETFKKAVSQIESSRMTVSVPNPVTAPMSSEINHGLRNEKQREEGERTPEEISVPIVTSDVVSASSGNSSSDWRERIDALKKAKKASKKDD